MNLPTAGGENCKVRVKKLIDEIVMHADAYVQTGCAADTDDLRSFNAAFKTEHGVTGDARAKDDSDVMKAVDKCIALKPWTPL